MQTPRYQEDDANLLNSRGSSNGLDSLTSAFRQVVADGEELLRTTANYSAEGLAAARDRFQTNLDTAKAKMLQTQGAMRDRAGQAASAAEDYTSANPWKALAIAGSLGVIIGLLMTRSK